MKPTIGVDTREWQAASRQLFETSSRTCVDFTNGQALKVATEAIKNTAKANRREVERTLGVLASREKLRKGYGRGKGKRWVRVTSRLLLENSFAERIVAKRFRETGSWGGLKGDTIQEKAMSLIRQRARAVGFIKSGWIPAVRKLAAIVYKKPRGLGFRRSEAQQFGRDKGSARPAIFSLRSKIETIIQNTALMANQGKAPAPGGNPMPVAVAGLNAALRVASADMLAELARRLQPDFKRVSAK